MNLFIRLIVVVLAAFRKPAVAMLDETRLSMRVWPNDLDTNAHMNNGRYLTVMDLGRVDLIVRSGLWPVVRARKWYPVLGAAAMVYRRSLAPFQRYALTTRVLGWDEKWIFIEHRFMVGDTLHARGVVKTLFLKGREKVPTADIARSIGHDGASPELDPAMLAALG